MNKYLITCSNEKTWDVKKQIVFLGEWCTKYSKKHLWKNLKYEVSKPYGVSSNQKNKDAKLVTEIERDLITKIKIELNTLHSVNYNERMWTIILGPWLRRYSGLIVNRFHTIKQCFEEFNITETTLLNTNENILIKENSSDSYNAFNENLWNQHLLFELFKILNYKDLKINFVEYTKKTSAIKNNHKIKNFIILTIKKITNFTNFLAIKNSTVTIQLYALYWEQFLIHLNLKIFPFFRFTNAIKTNDIIDQNLRDKLTRKILDSNKEYDAKDVAALLLFKLLPKCYVEGFKTLISITDKTVFPHNPKHIITSVNCDTDEVFKLWLVKKIKSGALLTTYQHGNHYGTHKYNNPSIDELISDKFITWGWKNDNNKYIASQIFRKYDKLNQNKNYNLCSKIYLIENTINPNYHTEDVHYEFNNYYSEQKKFILNLDKEIKKNIIIKLHVAYTYMKKEEDLRWRNFDKNLTVMSHYGKFKNIVKDARLIIFSYDSTGFLEALASNTPCISFWQNGLDHIRDEAIEDYNDLIKSELLFFSPDKAAKKVNQINSSLLDWWYSDEVQNIRLRFSNKYANTSNPNLNATLKKLIKKY